jgi:hypothetical protein
MDYYTDKVYQFIVNKLTKPGLTLLLFLTLIVIYYTGLAEYLSMHLFIVLTFYPPIPYFICILIGGIVLVEGVWVHTYIPFIICRRRIDVPNAPWESFEAFILEYDEEDTHEFFDFQNDFFSNDGFCPRSFAEMDTPYETVIGERIQSRAQIKEFFKFVAPRMGHQFNKTYIQSLTFPTKRDEKGLQSIYGTQDHLWFRIKFWYGNSLIERAPLESNEFIDTLFENFEPPHYYKSQYYIDQDTDFEELGISLVSGSAEDSSSYIYEVEQPGFFPSDTIDRILDNYDPKEHKLRIRRRLGNYYGIRNMGTFMENMTVPEKYTYNNNYELLEEYPVNINKFYIKREWEENPDALTFRDPLTGNYANLTRFTSCSLNLDLNLFRREFFLTHKAPRRTKLQIKGILQHVDKEFVNRNSSLPQYINISRFILPEFPRFGWLSYLQSLVERGLRYYVVLDKERAHKLYSGFPGELELLPTGSIFNYVTFLFKPETALFKRLCVRVVGLLMAKLGRYEVLFFNVLHQGFILFSMLVNRVPKAKSVEGIHKWIISKTTNNQNLQTKKLPCFFLSI